MTDFARQVIVDNFATLPDVMQVRLLRLMRIDSVDQLDTVDSRRLTAAAQQVTSYLLRPQRPVTPTA